MTGAGKTRLAVAAIEEQLRRGRRSVVVPTKELLNQWQREIRKLVATQLGVSFSIGLLGDHRFRRPDVLVFDGWGTTQLRASPTR